MEDIIDSVRQFLGKGVVRHHEVVPDCWNKRLPQCFETGLGPDTFDCSGLVITSICKAINVSVDQWPRDLRHVREIWNDGNAQIGRALYDLDKVEDGDLLVLKKRIPINGVQGYYPCHIGIAQIFGVGELGIVHTTLATRTVQEQRISERFKDRLLGAIKIDEEKLFSTLDM